MIKIKNLAKKFKNNVIFENLNLQIPKNKLIFITGKSGSGKTSLLNIISGIDSDYEGTLQIKKNNHQTNIDYVFQDFNLFEQISAVENVEMGNNILGKKNDFLKLSYYVNLLDLSDFVLRSKVKNLSGGEKQRVAILRSLMRDPEIILIDEPTANLDEKNTLKIFSLLKKISQFKTVIVVSHDLQNAEKFADQIYDLEEKKLKKNFLKEKLQPKITSKKKKKKKIEYDWKNKVKPVKIFLKSDLKSNFFGFFLFFLTIIFSVFFVAFSLNLLLITNKINYRNLIKTNSDVYFLEKKDNSYFYRDEEEKIKKLNPQHFLKTYDYGENFYLNWGENFASFSTKNLVQIDDSNFFKNRIQIKKNTFENIEKDNQIILGFDVIEKLGIKNWKNQKIKFSILDRDQIELEIVGVNYEKNYDNSVNTYIKNTLINKINIEEKNSQNYTIYQDKSSIENYFSFGKVSSAFQKIKNFKNNISLKTNEIIVPKDWNLSEGKSVFIQKNGQGYFIAKIFGKYDDVKKQKVVYGNSFFVDSLQEKNYFKKINLYLKNASDDDHIKKYSEFKLTSMSDQITKKFIKKSQKFSKLILFISLIIFVFSLLILFILSKIMLDTRKKELMILKTLGSRKNQTLFYHFSSLVFIFLVVLVFTIIFFYPSEMLIFKLFDNFFNFYQISFFLKFFIYFLSWSVLFVFTSFFYWIIFIKIFKTNIVKIFR